MSAYAKLHNDRQFTSIAAGFRTGRDAPRPPLTDTLAKLRSFGTARARDVRIAQLEEGGRRVAAEWRIQGDQLADAMRDFHAAVTLLHAHVTALRPMLSAQLDDVIMLAADKGSPMRNVLEDAAHDLGFTRSELDWFWRELAHVEFRPARYVADDLATLLAGISVGEVGLHRVGFVRTTGDEALDRQLVRVVVRLREQGLTASLFLVLALIIAADAVATAPS